MLTAIPSQHKTGSLDQFIPKNISTDCVAGLSFIPTDTIDNPILKQLYWEPDVVEENTFSKMKLESNRLYSFDKRWPRIDIKPESLAAAGFFYLQQEDRVQCPFCYVIIFNWTGGDKPLREHMRKSPKCPFLVGSDVGNIPLVPGKQNNICLSSGLSNGHSSHSVTASYKPKHPRMADIKRRLLTFSGWPLTKPSPEELAECGLYYSGVADVATCFFCGGTLGNWEPDDDPWVEHSKFFSDCSFLAVTKSRHSASATMDAATWEKENDKNRVIEAKQKSYNTSSDIIQQALDIFPDHLVFDALKKIGDTSSLQELCDEILDTKQQSHHESKVVVPVKTDSTSGNNSCTASSDAILCKLCMDRERGVVFQPCGHLVSCWQCSNLIADCPVCRRPIIHKIKTYFS